MANFSSQNTQSGKRDFHLLKSSDAARIVGKNTIGRARNYRQDGTRRHDPQSTYCRTVLIRVHKRMYIATGHLKRHDVNNNNTNNTPRDRNLEYLTFPRNKNKTKQKTQSLTNVHFLCLDMDAVKPRVHFLCLDMDAVKPRRLRCSSGLQSSLAHSKQHNYRRQLIKIKYNVLWLSRWNKVFYCYHLWTRRRNAEIHYVPNKKFITFQITQTGKNAARNDTQYKRLHFI
jgi:hypothetical protein